MSLLLMYIFVRLFVNALTDYDKHYLLNRDNLTILKKRMSLIADVFLKLRAPKNVVR